MAPEIPRPPLIADPAGVAAGWMTEVLGRAGVLGDAVVTGIERRRVGTGLVGQNVAFSLSYDRPARAAPVSVVGKFPSPERQSRETAIAFRTYEREVRFYQEIAGTVDIRTPACYFADIDLDTGAFTLLLEDLRPAAQGDQVAGCSLDQAVLAMEELAALHGARWADPTLAETQWLSQLDDRPMAELIRNMYQSVWPGFVAQYGGKLDADALELGEALGRSLEGWWTAWEPPFCITHGDYRIDNMLFGTEEGGYPLATVDWQTIGHGPGILDATYFLGNSLTVRDRRAHETDLLKGYHDALLKRGVTGYGWKSCREGYRRATLSGIIMMVIASQVVATDDRGVAMFAAAAGRHFAHALDHRAGETLTC
jgi:hypothetical protein